MEKVEEQFYRKLKNINKYNCSLVLARTIFVLLPKIKSAINYKVYSGNPNPSDNLAY